MEAIKQILIDEIATLNREERRDNRPRLGWPAEHFSREDQRDAQTVAQVHHRPQAGMVFQNH
jgi:hypothetical protein